MQPAVTPGIPSWIVSQPRLAINAYLAAVYDEALKRGYSFDKAKIGPVRTVDLIPVAEGQLSYEWMHLKQKLAIRNPDLLAQWSGVSAPECHPLFSRRPGPMEPWERGPATS